MNFIVDKTMPSSMLEKLNTIGNVHLSTVAKGVDSSLSTHPDLQIHFVDDCTAVCGCGLSDYYKALLTDRIEILEGNSKVGNTYPENCAYNIVRLGDFVICNTKISDKKILEIYKKQNKTIIHVNQGYTKCSICPIDKDIFITEDIGIYNTINGNKKLKSVLIPRLNVRLDGFDYGFIGGATGIYGNTLLLCGKIPDTKEGEVLLSFLTKNHIKYIELSSDSLYDYGSILSF